ncbi:hypothetical protein BGW39_001798, partial [Mortierella sp. 14UC]
CLASLPEELQEMIATYLTQHDFALCARVCQAWQRFFTPLVWRHVETNPNFMRKLSWDDTFLQSARSGALKTHGQWIQSICLGCYPDFIQKFLLYSPATFPRLTSLTFCNPERDDVIEDFISRASRGSGLKRLDIVGFSGFADFGGGATDALLLHASTLEVLRLDMVPAASSKDIQQLLSSAPKLREFDIIGHERDTDNDEIFLDARDVVSSDWVCTGLEVFACRIGGIPRPDITRQIDGEPASKYVKSGTLQESIDLHRGVYAQLGRLTRLRELTLGVSIKATWGYNSRTNERFRLYDCPAMSLASGMDMLKELRQLESVRLRDMEVSIMDDEERAWSKEHWPKVEVEWDR